MGGLSAGGRSGCALPALGPVRYPHGLDQLVACWIAEQSTE